MAVDTQINQEHINSAAWAACDTFRGVVDPAQYKDYILVTLFLKYISDVWKDHYENYAKQYGGDDERIRRKLERERFVLPMVNLPKVAKGKSTEKVLADYYTLFERREADNLGELFMVVLDAIEEGNKLKLEGVFRNIDFNSEPNLGKTKDRNRRLKMLLEDFHKPQLDMGPSHVSEDVIGNTYIYLIERFASDAGKKAGEFFTPSMVTRLVAKLAGPQKGDRVCDPACGSGGLLIQTAKEIGNNDYALFGQESNGSTWALCRMNMFLHSADSARIEWCDTLNNPTLVEKDKLMRFNVVVANPPFSLDKWGAENAESDRFNRFWRGVPPKSKGDWAFISHMVEIALEKEGRVAVVVPHGVLFRGGAEGRIRQAMIDENILDAVVGLPANMFPTTGIPVAILVFDKRRQKGGSREKVKDVIFVDASREFAAGKNQNNLTDENIAKIVKTVAKRAKVDKYALPAKLDEIKENEYNLNIPRYVDTFEEEEAIDIDAVQKEINQLEAELVKVKAEMAKKLKEIQR